MRAQKNNTRLHQDSTLNMRKNNDCVEFKQS